MDVLEKGWGHSTTAHVEVMVLLVMWVKLVMTTHYARHLYPHMLRLLLFINMTAMLVRGQEHCSIAICIDMHHVIVNIACIGRMLLVHHLLMLLALVLVLRLPAAGTRARKVFGLAWTVLARSQHITHASLVGIEATQLRYSSFILLTLVKLNMLGCRFNALLNCKLFSLLLLSLLRLLMRLALLWRLYFLNLRTAGHKPTRMLLVLFYAWGHV